MLSRPRSNSRTTNPRLSATSGKKLDLLNAVEFRDRRVLRAVYGLPWEHFSAGDAPFTTARMTELVRMLEALNLTGTESVLDVGTGAGYRAALLGSLAAHVRTIELVPNVAATARHALNRVGSKNVEIIEGDGSLGWPSGAPYQAILVGRASPDVPNQLINQLDEGGRLVIPIGNASGQLITRLCRRGDGIESTTLAPCVLKQLAFRGERRSSYPWLPLPSG